MSDKPPHQTKQAHTNVWCGGKFKHTPVLPKESIELLDLKPNGTYVDCTLGGGGHTEKLKTKNAKCKIIGIDADAEALAAAKVRLAKFDNIEYVHDNFRSLKDHVKDKVDGILFDLGVSSHQIDEASRGFSIQNDGPLDMRMDQGQKLSAAEIINRSSQDELEKIFKEYGEERFFRRVARAVIAKREGTEIKTTFQLKEIVEKAIPTWKKRESVTRVFQALRIAVNQELKALETALHDAIDLLKPGGRIVIISYHSLEDRIAKQALRQAKQDGKVRVLTKKPLRPQAEEISSNARSRSAKLRAAEKIS